MEFTGILQFADRTLCPKNRVLRSTSTWLHAAVNHDFCSVGGCVLKRIKRNDRKVRSEKKRRFDRKGRRKIKFDQMHFIPSILSSLASLEVPGPTKSPPA